MGVSLTLQSYNVLLEKSYESYSYNIHTHLTQDMRVLGQISVTLYGVLSGVIFGCCCPCMVD